MKSCKSIISFLLAVLMIAGCVFNPAVVVRAVVADSSAYLTVADTKLTRGDTFTVEAYLNNAEAIRICTMTLDYDESVLELTGGTSHISGAMLAQVLPDKKVGTAMLNAATVVSGHVYTFNFTVKADAPYGTYDIGLEASIGAAAGEYITATGTSVEVASGFDCEHVWGDWSKVDEVYRKRICKECGAEETSHIEYSIIFQYEDGSVIQTHTLHYGEVVPAPKAPAAPAGYEFVGWDKDVVACSGDAIYTAVFRKTEATASTAYLAAPAVGLKRGDTFAVEAFLTNEQTTRICTLKLSYDDTALEMIGGTCRIPGVKYGDVILEKKVGTAVLNDPTVVDGWVYTFEFKVKEDAGYGIYDIDVKAAIGDYVGSYISATGAKVEIVSDADCLHSWGAWTPVDETYQVRTCGLCGTNETAFIEYTVSFLYADGALFTEYVLHYGDAVPNPGVPSAPSGYKFDGWDKEIVNCNGNATYTAVFSQIEPAVSKAHIVASANALKRGDTFTVEAYLSNTQAIRICTVTLDYDESVLEMTGGACHIPNTMLGMVKPSEKVGTAMLQTDAVVDGLIYTFEFKVKEDAAPGNYDINVSAAIGEKEGAYIPADGTQIEIIQENCDHSWGEWTPVDKINQKRTCGLCGAEQTDYIEYTVTFLYADGELFAEYVLHYGDAVPNPGVPSAPSGYQFAGWDKTVVNCTGNVTYTATFREMDIAESDAYLTVSATELKRGDTFTVEAYLNNVQAIRLCTIALKYDDSALVLTGGTCHIPGTTLGMVKPDEKVGTAMLQNAAAVNGLVFSFEFEVKDDAAYGAYAIDVIASIGETTGEYIPATGANVEIIRVGNCDHSWSEWMPVDNTFQERVCGLCGAEETAYIEYTVTFQYEDGTVIKQYTLHYGDTVVTPATPVAPDGYEFVGWDKEIGICTGNLTYTATFRETEISASSAYIVASETELERGDTFTVTAYLNNTNAIRLGTVVLEYNDALLEMISGECHIPNADLAQVIPANKAGTFMLGDAAAVSGKLFTFTFKVREGAALGTCTIDSVVSIGVSTGAYIPTKGTQIEIVRGSLCEHVWSAWTKVDHIYQKRICSNCKAEETSYIEYTVTFRYEDGTVIKQYTLHYGDTVPTPATPSAPNSQLEFAGWDREVVNCEGDATYTATFQQVTMPTPSAYLVMDSDGLRPGDTFTVEVYLNNTQAIRLGTAALEYDDAYLEMISGECHVPNVTIGQVIPSKKAGTFMLGSTAVVSGKVFSFTFRVKDDAPFGKSDINLNASIGAAQGEEIPSWGATIEIVCDHVWADWEKADETYQKRFCYICGAEETSYIEYLVTFQYEDGRLVRQYTLHYGDAIPNPGVPAAPSNQYIFMGWDKEILTCNGNMTFTATFLWVNVPTPGACVIPSSNSVKRGDTFTVDVYLSNLDAIRLCTVALDYNQTILELISGECHIPNTKLDGVDTALMVGSALVENATVISGKVFTFTFKVKEDATLGACDISANVAIGVDNGEEIPVVGTQVEILCNHRWGAWSKVDDTYQKHICEICGDEETAFIDYTVTFYNWDGTVLASDTYHWGDTVVVPEALGKEADNTFTYTFAGWDKTVVNCAGNATYTAVYAPSYINYTVTFYNWDGTVLSSKTYHWGDKVAAPSDPTKPSDATFRYEFSGWDKEVVNCAGDVTYTAVYTPKYNVFTITFVNDNGDLIDKQTYTYGSVVTPPANPTKANDNIYRYTFAGWDKEIVNCTANATYTATYTAELIDYTVTFVDADGTELSKQTYHWGDEVVVPADPTKAADNVYTYEFAGWDQTVGNCAGNATYKATYKATYIDYTVIFVDEDGTKLSEETYHWGDVVVAPNAPTKVADKVYTYEFAGWDQTVVNCAGNATYKATYKANYIDYTVTFVDEDGTKLSEQTYHWGDEVVAPAAPTKAADKVYTYEFAGWDQTVVNCAGNATYKATYKASYIDYTVLFVNEDGTKLSEKTYHWGDKVIAPAAPTKAADKVYSYIFAGWDKEVVSCAGNATYTATYSKQYVEYTVIFADEDGTEHSRQTYHWGDEVVEPAAPTKAADRVCSYTFISWDKDVVSCAGNVTYTAVYEKTYREYTVVFKNDDGKVLSTAIYHWGDTVVVPAAPTKATDKVNSYTFAGWGKTVTTCMGNATYTAKFTANPIPYMITFQYEDGTLIRRDTYHYGDEVTAPTDVTVPGNLVDHVFAGWDRDVVACEGYAIYTARFVSIHDVFTVTFRYEDGTVIKTEELRFGEAVTEPAEPAVPESLGDDYMFGGWDKTVTECRGDTVYTAVFKLKRLDGDLDNNGVVDADDVVTLLFHVTLPEMFPIDMDADYDGNGITDADDVVTLLFHVTLPDMFPLRPNKVA